MAWAKREGAGGSPGPIWGGGRLCRDVRTGGLSCPGEAGALGSQQLPSSQGAPRDPPGCGPRGRRSWLLCGCSPGRRQGTGRRAECKAEGEEWQAL